VSTQISNVSILSIFAVAIGTENGLMLPDNKLKLITATPHRAARSSASGPDWVTSSFITHLGLGLGQLCFDTDIYFPFCLCSAPVGAIGSSRITV